MIILRIFLFIATFIFTWAIATIVAMYTDVFVKYLCPANQLPDSVYKRKIYSIYGFLLAVLFLYLIFR